jgi:vancomycin resistance protein VanW
MSQRMRSFLRRRVPFAVRLRVRLVRRAVSDRLSGVRFAAQKGQQSQFRYEWCRYERPIIDYPGQEHLGLAKRKNQALLAASLDGAVIRPGETFSVWRLAGRPSARRGFLPAAALKDRQLTTDTGGATCLLSTVLYNVGLLGPLQVFERHAHSVDSYGANRYFELGRDAAIEYGYLDLRLRNWHPWPLMLTVTVEESRIVATLRGTLPRPFDVDVIVGEPEIVPAPTALASGLVAPGDGKQVLEEGLPGLRVRTRRLVTRAGMVICDEDLGLSVHHAVPRA